MEDMQLPGFLNDPSVKKTALKMLEVIQDKKFQDSANAIIQNPHLKWCLASLFATFLVFAFIRYRVMSALKSIWLKILFRVVLFFLFPSALCGVAYLFFGDPLVYILKQSIKIFSS